MNPTSKDSKVNLENVRKTVIDNIKNDIKEKCNKNMLYNCPCGKTKKIIIRMFPEKIEAYFIENKNEKVGYIEKEHSTKVNLDLELMYSPDYYHKELSNLKSILDLCDVINETHELDDTGIILHSYLRYKFECKCCKIISEYVEYACNQGLGEREEFQSELNIL